MEVIFENVYYQFIYNNAEYIHNNPASTVTNVLKIAIRDKASMSQLISSASFLNHFIGLSVQKFFYSVTTLYIPLACNGKTFTAIVCSKS